jgi:hypothetical protein
LQKTGSQGPSLNKGIPTRDIEVIAPATAASVSIDAIERDPAAAAVRHTKPKETSHTQ